MPGELAAHAWVWASLATTMVAAFGPPGHIAIGARQHR